MFVTSFSQDGYKLYGEKFLLSFLAHSDESITVYYEDVPPPLTDERIIYKNLFDVPGCLQFLEVCLRVPAFKGEVNGKVNYRYNIFRFSRKSFAQIDAAQYDDNAGPTAPRDRGPWRPGSAPDRPTGRHRRRAGVRPRRCSSPCPG